MAIIEFAERSLCDTDRSLRDLVLPREITENFTEIVESLRRYRWTIIESSLADQGDC